MDRVEQMKQIQKEALDLFIKKNADYGDAFATSYVLKTRFNDVFLFQTRMYSWCMMKHYEIH